MPKYPRQPDTVSSVGYENIRKSTGCSFLEKRSHILSLLNCGTDSVLASKEHEALRLPKIRQGEELKKLLPDEGLGVAVEENNFIKYTAKAFGRGPADFKKLLNNCISYFEKREKRIPTTASEDLSAKAFLSAAIPARADGNIWLFRNPDRDRDAFANVAGPWLGHRLGLPLSSSGEVRLTFSFPAAYVSQARRPAIFDVHWSQLDIWHWGGITKPLPQTPKGMEGLEEVVSEPPEIGRINRPIARITFNPA